VFIKTLLSPEWDADEGLGLGALATVLVGTLSRPVPGEATRLRWASAGHLPPVVVGSDGTTQVLDSPRPGLMLGVDAGRPRQEHERVLEPGSTLLLYTDGLVERRDQVFDDGVALLARALPRLGDRSVDDLCDDLLAHLLPQRAEDDVALVAVRLRAG